MKRKWYIRTSFLSKSKQTVEQLTKKELKEYNNLKPKVHSTEGINLPLYYKYTKGNTVSYSSSYIVGDRKKKVASKRILTGLLTGLLTFDVLFNWENIDKAFLFNHYISLSISCELLN